MKDDTVARLVFKYITRFNYYKGNIYTFREQGINDLLDRLNDLVIKYDIKEEDIRLMIENNN